MPGDILDLYMVRDVAVDKFLCTADQIIIGFHCCFLGLGIFGRCVAVHRVNEF